jgi:hypothetical protein
MKTERARELYTDYAEGTLSPALSQALEQHFEAEPEARADYQQFEQVFVLLGEPLSEEVEVPLGFRAKVMELAAEEHARREALPSRRATLSLGAWIQSLRVGSPRRASVGMLASFAVMALAGVFIYSISSKNSTGNNGPILPLLAPTTINAVTVLPAGGTGMTHLFHIHLPENVNQASVMAYVVTSTDQITDPNTRKQALPALKQPQELTNNEEMQIPVTLLHQAPAGTTLNLFVQWTPNNTNQTPGAQVVFTPMQPGVVAPPDATDSPTGAFFDELQDVAAHYGVTVVADATVLPSNAVTISAADNTPLKALQDIAQQVHDKVQMLPNGAYQVYTQ